MKLSSWSFQLKPAENTSCDLVGDVLYIPKSFIFMNYIKKGEPTH